jgi:hypothetical protein
MSRYISHGGFGIRGIDRVALLESRSTGVFSADYRDKAAGRHIRRSLKTTDLNEAKLRVAEIMKQRKDGRPANPKRETILYVIRRGEDGPIKVGITRSLKLRLADLQCGNAEKLKVLRVYRMGDVEKAVHAELERKSRLEGEWFPADLLTLVDRFFNISADVAWKRARERHEAATAEVKRWASAGLL